MRTEQVAIETVNLCDTCPKRADCVGVAKVAVDSYMKVSFFTINVPKGDPEAFVSRVYVDDNGGESDMFLVQDEALINACKGPVKTRSEQKRFGRKFLDCGAHTVTVKKFRENLARADEQWRKDHENSFYLTPEETRAMYTLEPELAAELINMPDDDLKKLILFGRQHPKQVDELKQMASRS